MSKIPYAIAALILIAAIIPVHAAYNTGLIPVRFTSETGQNIPPIFADASAHTAFCVGKGFTRDPANYAAMSWYGDGDLYGDTSYYGAYNVGSNAGAAWRYAHLLGGCLNSTGHSIWVTYAYDYRKGYSYNDTINADFTGTPREGTGPLSVAFTDTSLGGGILTYNWSIIPATGWYVTSGTINSKNIGVSFVTNGNYSVSHGITNNTQSDIETKNDYIWIYNSTSLSTTGFQTINVLSGIPLGGSVISLYDVENGTWKNTTTGPTGDASITTLASHTINAYASIEGFDDNDLLAQPAYNGHTYPIMMVPSGHSNVTPGNVTLYVTVDEVGTHKLIKGANVQVSYVSGGMGATILSGYTTDAGTVSFAVPNKTSIIVQARADSQGYLPGSQSINSGTGSGGSASVALEIALSKNIVTPTETITTLPGGGTPTPTVTILPYCDPSASDYDAAKCRQSHSNSSLNFLAENMDTLIMICVFVTIMYLLGFKLGR